METAPRKTKRIIPRILLAAVTLLVGVGLGVWQVKPPRVNKNSPDFPAYLRMMGNIERLAVNPHPNGSAELELVRAQILAEIEGMGLLPAVEEREMTASEFGDMRMWRSDTTRDEWWAWAGEEIEKEYGVHSFDEWFAFSTVGDYPRTMRNILVKLDAPDTERGVLFVSHYDSVRAGPGAADDMTAVCAMLEAMRAHSQNGAPANDIYFLFTDGEEADLLGAWQFAQAHPELRKKICMTINMEARGSRGGLLLFETSPQAYRQIQTAVKAGARPVGASWAAAIYGMMSNNTDFTIFLKSGYQGINFAAIEGVEHYHSPTDTYENLNKSTAWHYLKTALALADYAANYPLDGLLLPSRDAVFFPFLPGVLVLMSSLTTQILCAAACVLALAAVVIQIKNKRLKCSFSIVLMGLLVVFSIVSAVFFPAGSYLFYIPLFVTTVTKLLKGRTAAYITALALSGVTALLLWVPVVYLLWVSLVQPMML